MTARHGASDILTSRRHPLVRRMRRIAGRPALGRREGRFLLEGVHLCEEALAAEMTPEQLLWAPRLERTARGRSLLQELHRAGWPLRAVSDEVLESLALTDTPQGVVGLFPRPPRVAGADLAPVTPSPAARPARGQPFALALDGVQDPVNLGALARAAWAFGCTALLTLGATVDPFHPRALRASSGMLLHLRMACDLSADALFAWVQAQTLRLVALAPRGGPAVTLLPRDGRPIVLLLGSEGRGFSPEVARLATERISIPMRPEAESLGVAAAGAIALYLLAEAVEGG